MAVQVAMLLTCDEANCGRTATTGGGLTATIENGGRIEIELEPRLPEGWKLSQYGGIAACPDHDLPKWAQ